MEQSPYHFILKTNFDPIIIFKIQYIYYYYFFMCVQNPVKPVFANSLKSQLKTFFPPLNFHCLIILFSSPLSFLEQQVSFSSFSPLFFAAIFAASKLFLEMTRNHHQIADTMTSLRGEGGGREILPLNHSVAKCEILLGFLFILQAPLGSLHSKRF